MYNQHVIVRITDIKINCLKNIFSSIIFLVCFCCLPQVYSIENSAVHTLRFADTLFTEGDYLQAGIEYQRCLSYLSNPGDVITVDVNEVKLKLARAYFLSKKNELAFTSYFEVYNSSAEKDSVTCEIALANFLLGHYELSRGQVEKVVSSSKYYGKAVILRARNYLREGKYKPAAVFIAKVVKDVELVDPVSASVLAGMYSKLSGLKLREPKNAVFAGVISAFIPGTGQVYCGRVLDGVYAFIINALAISAAYTSFNDGNNSAGVLITTLGIPFYAGNVVNAANYAEVSNRRYHSVVCTGIEEGIEKSVLEVLYHKKWGDSVVNTNVRYPSVGEGAVVFYQKIMSSQRSSVCVFYPSCSEYGKLCMIKHGVAIGSCEAAARMLRCHSSSYGYYYKDDNGKLADPVNPILID